MDMLAARLGHRPAGVPRCATRSGPATAPRPARCSAPGAALPPASMRCGRAGGRCARRRGWNAASAARRAAASGIACMWYGIGNTACPIRPRWSLGHRRRRPRRAVLRRGRYRPGLQHGHAADRGRRARACRSASLGAGRRRHRPHPRCRQDQRLAPDLRQRQRRAAGRRGAARRDPAPGQCRRRRRAIRLERGAICVIDGAASHAIELRALARRPRRLRAARRRTLRPADHAARRRRPGHPVRDLRLRRAGADGRGGYRPRHGHACCASSPPTTSAARSTRRWSRARSTAASPRASGSR